MAQPGIPTLTTARLVLRPFVPDDLDELAALHAEESFWWYPLRARHGRRRRPPSSSQRVLARYESDGFGIEALIDRDERGHDRVGGAGRAALPARDPARRSRWAGAWPGPGVGRGLATEAGAAAVDFGFTTGGLDRIVSIYEPENVASGRVMERLGFTHRLTTTGARGEEVAVRGAHCGTDWEERRGRG